MTRHADGMGNRGAEGGGPCPLHAATNAMRRNARERDTIPGTIHRYMWWGPRESRRPDTLALGAGILLALALAIVA